MDRKELVTIARIAVLSGDLQQMSDTLVEIANALEEREIDHAQSTSWRGLASISE